MGRLPVLAVILIALLLCGTLLHAQGGRPLVKVMTINGPISPATALYVQRAIGIAEQDKAQALIIHIDTPGGLMDSMEEIVKDIFASDVPVVVYVWPKTAHASSAGAIITLAGNIAAMAPGTSIGSAHPVQIGGGGTGDQQPKQNGVMEKKLEEYAAAYARSIAKQRGRNVKWADDAIRKSISSTEVEAKKLGVIDVIANDDRDLLRQIDGRRVKLEHRTATLHTKDARTEDVGPSLRERFLAVIANPNIVLILMTVAIYGIIFELSNPGSIFPGIIGGIALILALFSFAVLPVSTAGVALIIFAAVLFIADVFIPGHGILSVGGVISFIIGALILFNTTAPEFRVSLSLTITLALATAAFFLFAVGSGIRAQKARVVTGREGMVGEVTEARTDIDPKGKVFLEGSYWNAISDSGPIKQGELVRVVGMDGLTLHVRKES